MNAPVAGFSRNEAAIEHSHPQLPGSVFDNRANFAVFGQLCSTIVAGLRVDAINGALPSRPD